MQRRRSASGSKNSKRKSLPKKKVCNICSSSLSSSLMVQHALYAKYSRNHFTEPRKINELLVRSRFSDEGDGREHLSRYYKAVHRKHEFKKVKEIYRMHQEFPRLFMLGTRDILAKHHQRRRLLDYFRMAKVLGIKVEDVKFSTFLFSLTKSFSPLARRKPFVPLLTHISGYEFSEDIERQIVQALAHAEANPEAAGWPEYKIYAYSTGEDE